MPAVLEPNGTMWVSGTAHVYLLGRLRHATARIQDPEPHRLGKAQPPPNLSCRYFTHATETLLWAAKDAKLQTRLQLRADEASSPAESR